MNETVQLDMITLQAIFSDSYQQLSETQVQFTYASVYYKCDFDFTITYSQKYPNERLTDIQIECEAMHHELVQNIRQRISQLQDTYLNNENQTFVYQIVSSIDDEQYQLKELKEEQVNQVESSDDNDTVLIKINHGELPGMPVTDENFNIWFNDFLKKKNIKLVSEDDWTQIDYSKEMGADFTGYEYFKRKMYEDENVE